MIDNLWDFYLFRGRVIIPTFACTESAWMHVAPVRVAELADDSSVTSAIIAALSAGNPQRTFRSDLKSLVARHANAKSEREFEREAKGWSLERVGDRHTIVPYRQRPDGRGWEEDQGLKTALPGGISHADIARRLLELMRAAEVDATSMTHAKE